MSYPWEILVDAAWGRFVAKLDTSRGPEGCWLWIGAKSRGKGNRDWYGSFAVGVVAGVRYIVRAHIFAAVAAGLARPGLTRDHICGNGLCVNPLHLEETTRSENSLRRWVGRRWRRAA